MKLEYCCLEDIKAIRPDLYHAIEQETLLSTIKLNKADIIDLLMPISDKIVESLGPYLDQLPTMTTNDIIDMENEIIDEMSNQLQDVFTDLENIVRKRFERRRFVSRDITPLLER